MTVATAILSGDSGLSRYFVNKTIPNLERGRGIYARQELHRTRRSEAAHKLVTSHLRLVAK